MKGIASKAGKVKVYLKVMVQYQGVGQSGKLAPPVEGIENQHFKLLIGEDYANRS